MLVIGYVVLVLLLADGGTHVYQYQTYDACLAGKELLLRQANDVVAAGCAPITKKDQ